MSKIIVQNDNHAQIFCVRLFDRHRYRAGAEIALRSDAQHYNPKQGQIEIYCPMR
ncbi:MAG: hypothetical protein JJU08_07245 [Rhodobacteraceae bacterium]|nr:hypothetical protein [Paracoccaceae bacterium]